MQHRLLWHWITVEAAAHCACFNAAAGGKHGSSHAQASTFIIVPGHPGGKEQTTMLHAMHHTLLCMLCYASNCDTLHVLAGVCGKVQPAATCCIPGGPVGHPQPCTWQPVLRLPQLCGAAGGNSNTSNRYEQLQRDRPAGMQQQRRRVSLPNMQRQQQQW